MNEARWLSCEDPRILLEWLRGEASDRKLRLFACSFWRGWWHTRTHPQADGEPDPEILQLLQYAEQWAERGERPEGPIPPGFGWHPLVARTAFDAANWTIRETTGFKARRDCLRYDEQNRLQAAELQVRLLREVFGNPNRLVTLHPNWLTLNVVGLARTIYSERAFGLLPILAGTLTEAGCDTEEIVSHCRSDGPHVPGCWALDLILGRM